MMLALIGVLLALRLSADDVAVERVVLQSELQDIHANWFTTDSAKVLISDRTVPCVLPPTIEEEKRIDDLVRRAETDNSIDTRDFAPRPAAPDIDLHARNGVVPKDVVTACLAMKDTLVVPHDKTGLTLRPVFIAGTIERQKLPQRHRDAAGVITVSAPAYSRDHNLAAVTATSLRNGIGGSIEFYLLERKNGGWIVGWRQILLVE
jgi:hypothetical protein